jgi:hypothetical protein
MGKSCGRYGEKIVAYRVLVGKPKTKKPIGRLRNIGKSDMNRDF